MLQRLLVLSDGKALRGAACSAWRRPRGLWEPQATALQGQSVQSIAIAAPFRWPKIAASMAAFTLILVIGSLRVGGYIAYAGGQSAPSGV